MMDASLLNDIYVAIAMGVLGAVVFAAIGLVSGTDETTTLPPLTLLVVLLGVPPAGVFTFFLAGAVAKHMTHAVRRTPTCCESWACHISRCARWSPA
jgi:hypothetical protein